MNEIVTEHIVKEIGYLWNTLKVDGIKDETGCENISIIVRYVDDRYCVRERLLKMAKSNLTLT